MIDQFNIRVYGICIKNGCVLTLHEEYAGELLTKLPGGGLEFGESTMQCLKREFSEELNLDIIPTTHFYTQEDFLVSRFRDSDQLLSIYYLCEIQNEEDLLIIDPCIETAEWIPLREENPFQLPIDNIVFEKLKQQFL